jgi:hypothetical protein
VAEVRLVLCSGAYQMLWVSVLSPGETKTQLERK